MTFKVEKASNYDIQSLKKHIERAYRGESAKVGWTSESDLIDGKRLNDGELEEILSNNNKQIFIIRDPLEEGEILASICLYRSDKNCEFGMFAVNPEKQANGIGKVLLAFAENFAKKEWGFNAMRLSVISKRTNLIEFYKRRGYRPIGHTFSMSDHHLNEDMTRGHDLTLEIYEKEL